MLFYQQASFKPEQILKLHHIIADRLLERLFALPFMPEQILNIGCFDHYVNDQLITHYPKATIYNLYSNIYHNHNYNRNYNKNSYWLLANLNDLPFISNSFDLVISNLNLECDDEKLNVNFEELHRVMSTDALLLFTMCNYKNLDQNKLMNIGDLLLKQQFCDPVIDKDLFTINYIDSLGCKQKTDIELIYGHALGSNLVKTSVLVE